MKVEDLTVGMLVRDDMWPGWLKYLGEKDGEWRYRYLFRRADGVMFAYDRYDVKCLKPYEVAVVGVK